METILSVLYIIIANWWIISGALVILLSLLKVIAIKTKWVWDDSIITLLLGWLKICRGEMVNGKCEPKKPSAK